MITPFLVRSETCLPGASVFVTSSLPHIVPFSRVIMSDFHGIWGIEEMVEKTQIRDRLSDFTTDRRVIVLSGMAVVIGTLGALVADALVWLIGVITNLSFYQNFSATFTSPAGNHLGGWVIIVPVIGGLVIGLMARYGSERIRGHGIPEALEAILIGRSRMSPKVAVLKPISSAISIGNWRAFWGGRPDHHDGRGIGVTLCAVIPSVVCRSARHSWWPAQLLEWRLFSLRL